LKNPPQPAGLASEEGAVNLKQETPPMATSQVETISTAADKAKLATAVVLVIAAVVGFYLLGKQGAIAQWGALLVGLAAAVVVFLTAETGKQLVAFGRDAWREVKKVVWPTRKEAIQMTAYVFGFVVVMALFLWLTDKTLEWLFYDLILGWKK
jgi:preprotein translocase subunit SecE